MSNMSFTQLPKYTEDIDDSSPVRSIEHANSKREQNPKLSKTLSYVLRYGALLEGLEVSEGGYVDVQELIKLPIFKHYTEEEILCEIEISTTPKKHKRFQTTTKNGQTIVRAQQMRIFEKNPYHEGTKVSTLFESCLQHVTDNLDMYDLEDFPDEYLLNAMVMKLKRLKKLNNRSLRVLAVPTLTSLDFGEYFYVTESTLKCIYSGCPHLKDLNLRNHGYVITDHIITNLLKKLPELESLNLSGCNHLTDQTIHALCRYGKNLNKIFLSWIPGLTESAVLKLIRSCDKLTYLDIFDMTFSSDGRTTLVELLRDKPKLKVLLKRLGFLQKLLHSSISVAKIYRENPLNFNEYQKLSHGCGPKLPELESLNLSGCNHLTDQTIHALCRYGKNLNKIFLSWIPGLTESAVLKLIRSCDKLTYLDIFDMTFSNDGRTTLVELLRDKPKLKVLLKRLGKHQSGHSQPTDSVATSCTQES